MPRPEQYWYCGTTSPTRLPEASVHVTTLWRVAEASYDLHANADNGGLPSFV
jgi:hypothetical protein